MSDQTTVPASIIPPAVEGMPAALANDLARIWAEHSAP
jgi:hypothetical protein